MHTGQFRQSARATGSDAEHCRIEEVMRLALVKMNVILASSRLMTGDISQEQAGGCHVT